MDQYPDKETLVKFLAKVSLFTKADTTVLNHLADKTVVSTFPTDETVIRKGDIGDTLFLIFSGRLKVHDDEHIVAELKKGELFGELSMLDSEPRSMSVTTIEPSVLGSIGRTDFYEVLQQFPGITKDIIAVLNKRLRHQNEVLISEFKTREDQLKELVRIRTNELAQKNEELELAMVDLKKSQQQLIQSEKLASLGQLTAGIAHEIQNPLNFVNNFSILSQDLIKEAEEATSMEDLKEVLEFLKQNVSKIEHHGKRADEIVKGMLEQSRRGRGEKAPTNINALCEQYINLAYRNMTVNVPDFNAEIEKKFDPNLKEITVYSTDISRALLSLLNNAFYAVNAKRKKEGKNYLPKVEISTSMQDGKLFILFRDNGPGIPEKNMSKIFNPFFTTKPPGEGVGLGLSLSHDIVKAHGGEINVSSVENEFTEAVITIPY